jgi:hypothetical protein
MNYLSIGTVIAASRKRHDHIRIIVYSSQEGSIYGLLAAMQAEVAEAIEDLF